MIDRMYSNIIIHENKSVAV